MWEKKQNYFIEPKWPKSANEVFSYEAKIWGEKRGKKNCYEGVGGVFIFGLRKKKFWGFFYPPNEKRTSPKFRKLNSLRKPQISKDTSPLYTRSYRSDCQEPHVFASVRSELCTFLVPPNSNQGIQQFLIPTRDLIKNIVLYF